MGNDSNRKSKSGTTTRYYTEAQAYSLKIDEQKEEIRKQADLNDSLHQQIQRLRERIKRLEHLLINSQHGEDVLTKENRKLRKKLDTWVSDYRGLLAVIKNWDLDPCQTAAICSLGIAPQEEADTAAAIRWGLGDYPEGT